MSAASIPENQTSAAPTLRLPVHRLDGSATGEELPLNPSVFGLERNDHVLYLAVKTELTNSRQGTRATLTRGLVSGGGRKPWRQKGRGTARSGSTRSPIWRHGGTIFGPQPQEFGLKLPRKVKRLARSIALSVQAKGNHISLVEDFDFEQPKTRRIADFLKAFKADGEQVLLLLDGSRPNVVVSCRNIPRMEVREGTVASTRDILQARRVFITRTALASLHEGLSHD